MEFQAMNVSGFQVEEARRNYAHERGITAVMGKVRHVGRPVREQEEISDSICAIQLLGTGGYESVVRPANAEPSSELEGSAAFDIGEESQRLERIEGAKGLGK